MFKIICESNRFNGRWRVHHPDHFEGRVPCTEGSVSHCLDWVRRHVD